MKRTVITGLRPWMLQRLTAVAMLAFLLYVGLHFLFVPTGGYEAWHAWARSPIVSVCAAAFFGALLLHAWIGLRDVLMDYVKPLALRITLLSVVAIGLGAFGLWVLHIFIL
jgi:succinate dehydrogenase / fumarate reductase membrane anchor subunit